jgi:hypothetical protein
VDVGSKHYYTGRSTQYEEANTVRLQSVDDALLLVIK